MATKRITIDQLQIGMYVVGCDKSWLQTPFLAPTFLIKNQGRIDKLKQAKVGFVEIDLNKGADVAPPSNADPATAPSAPHPEITQNELRPPALAGMNGMSLAAEFSEARRLRQTMLHSVHNILQSIRTTGVVPVQEVKHTSEKMLARTLEQDLALVALIQTHNFDPHLYDHAVAVATLSVALGRSLGYDERWLQHLSEAALLHDVGLLHLPERLLKPSQPLSPEEQREFDAHVSIGVDILKANVGVTEEVRRLVEGHHLPPSADDDLCQKQLAQACRVLNTVDCYDELLSGQGGHRPLATKDVLQQLFLQAQQGRFELQIVSQLISLVGIFPVYSVVQLNTGHRGIVLRFDPSDILHPTVLLTHAPDRSPLHAPQSVNLSEQATAESAMKILTVLNADEEGIHVEELLQKHIAS
jgi:putative nucleotidyltransferase with HDIG domain